MKHLKIACTAESKEYFSTNRGLVLAENTDYTDVAAVVVTDSDADLINDVHNTKFGIPIFVVLKSSNTLDSELSKKVYRAIDRNNLIQIFMPERLRTL